MIRNFSKCTPRVMGYEETGITPLHVTFKVRMIG